MNEFNGVSDKRHLNINRELCAGSDAILRHVSNQTVLDIATILDSAASVFVVGVGHSGLLSRIFTMKLNHVGLRAYTVFDEINPPFESGSVLIAVSESGETATVNALAEKARKVGGTVVAFTGNPHSKLGTLAKESLVLSLVDTEISIDALSRLGDIRNQNVRGVLFGHALYSVFYSIVLVVAEIRDESPQSINQRHTNLQ